MKCHHSCLVLYVDWEMREMAVRWGKGAVGVHVNHSGTYWKPRQFLLAVAAAPSVETEKEMVGIIGRISLGLATRT